MHRRDPEKEDRGSSDDGVGRKQKLVVYFMAFLMVASVLAGLSSYFAN
jgi:hypothetical protein